MAKKQYLLSILLLVFYLPGFLYAQEYVPVKVYQVRSVRQAVAVDKNYFYTIGNREIGKYTLDGKWVDGWEESDLQKIKHMNSGIVIGHKLYCAHSNFPEVPMASSVEIFDTRTMKHIKSISLGIGIGSCTWILPHKNGWYVFFAHYDKSGEESGRNVRWSQLIEFDKQWHRKRGWILPDSLIERIRPHSLSGGVLINGLFCCTGHDRKEAYLLKIPDRGVHLEWTGTVSVPFGGQGIAVDGNGSLWGINGKEKQVIKTAARPIE